jgi:hypothetical protein
LRPRPSSNAGLPRYPIHLFGVPCPLPRRIGRVLMSIASPSVQPSPKLRRVGIRVITFEACSGFTHVTARRIAQPPKAAFVTRLRPGQLPDRAARQLPDLSTTLWVDPSSTGEPRHRGALNDPGFSPRHGRFQAVRSLPNAADRRRIGARQPANGEIPSKNYPLALCNNAPPSQEAGSGT